MTHITVMTWRSINGLGYYYYIIIIILLDVTITSPQLSKIYNGFPFHHEFPSKLMQFHYQLHVNAKHLRYYGKFLFIQSLVFGSHSANGLVFVWRPIHFEFSPPPTLILSNHTLVSFLFNNTPFPSMNFLNPERHMKMTETAGVPTSCFPVVFVIQSILLIYGSPGPRDLTRGPR